MELYEQVRLILAQQPLPDDAPEQIDKLLEQAVGQEARFIEIASESLFQLASEEQLKAWSIGATE